MIRVGRVNDVGAVYVGRPSPLGNPFAMRSEAQRAEVCEKYATWFAHKVAINDPRVMNELRRLYRLAQQGDLTLGCYCAPKRCHAETIKNFLDQFERS